MSGWKVNDFNKKYIFNHAERSTAMDGICAVALYDYQKDEDNEISLREGRIL